MENVRAALLLATLFAAACIQTPGAPAAARPALAPMTTEVDRSLVAPDTASDPDRFTPMYARLATDLSSTVDAPAPLGAKLQNWPLRGQITSPFGPRWGGFHTGLDIAAPMYTPVVVAEPGVVVTVGKPYLAFGDTATIVIVAHARGFATMYVHLDDTRLPPPVKVGSRVTAGTVVGFVGLTGFTTGPHLHFMTVVNGRMVDPVPYLP